MLSSFKAVSKRALYIVCIKVWHILSLGWVRAGVIILCNVLNKGDKSLSRSLSLSLSLSLWHVAHAAPLHPHLPLPGFLSSSFNCLICQRRYSIPLSDTRKAVDICQYKLTCEIPPIETEELYALQKCVSCSYWRPRVRGPTFRTLWQNTGLGTSITVLHVRDYQLVN